MRMNAEQFTEGACAFMREQNPTLVASGRVATYAYITANGKPHHVKIRIDPNDGSEKEIRIVSHDGSRFIDKNQNLVGMPMFREMRLASHSGEVIWHFEGEKCVLAAEELGLLATTTGGAGTAGRTDMSVLTARDTKTVIIWADNDEPGLEYRKEITIRYQELGYETYWVDLEQLGFEPNDKSDIVDYLAKHAHATSADIEGLAATLVPPGFGWEEPEQLLARRVPVMALTGAMLPEPIRDWLTDTAHRMQCPLDFVAIPAVIGLATILAGKCSVRPKRLDKWEVVPNLWGAIVGPPGSLKSAAINAALDPLKRIEQAANVDYENRKRTFEAEEAAWEAKRAAHRDQMKAAARQELKGDNSHDRTGDAPRSRRK